MNNLLSEPPYIPKVKNFSDLALIDPEFLMEITPNTYSSEVCNSEENERL